VANLIPLNSFRCGSELLFTEITFAKSHEVFSEKPVEPFPHYKHKSILRAGQSAIAGAFSEPTMRVRSKTGGLVVGSLFASANVSKSSTVSNDAPLGVFS